VTDILLRRASVALCLVGVGIAGYLTYVHYAGLRPICGISHGCETVQTSSYASLVGIPVALLGLITYVLILVTLCMGDERALMTGSVLTLIAFGFSAYLHLPRGVRHPRHLLMVRVERDRVLADGNHRHHPRGARRRRAGAGRRSGLGHREGRRRTSSALTGQALQRPSAGRIETRHLLREMAERDLPVLLDETFDLRLRSQGHVLIALVGGGVVVGLTLSPADEHALLVQAGHDRHVGRVCAFFRRALVERLHHGAHRSLTASPQLLHHLGLEFMQRRRNEGRCRWLALMRAHLRHSIAARGVRRQPDEEVRQSRAALLTRRGFLAGRAGVYYSGA
jgi:hypothetical protein